MKRSKGYNFFTGNRTEEVLPNSKSKLKIPFANVAILLWDRFLVFFARIAGYVQIQRIYGSNGKQK